MRWLWHTGFEENMRQRDSWVRSLICDGIGDDWGDSYLSDEESEMLTKILLDYDLTT
jgi:hypothetical protein